MDQLVQVAGIAGELTDQMLVMTTCAQRRPAFRAVQALDFGHFPYPDIVGAFFVNHCHGSFSLVGHKKCMLTVEDKHRQTA